jgi:hypothetical protein
VNAIKAFKEDKMKKVGSLWRKEGKKGNYLAGELDLGAVGKVQIAIFQNDLTEEDKERNKPTATICVFEE